MRFYLFLLTFLLCDLVSAQAQNLNFCQYQNGGQLFSQIDSAYLTTYILPLRIKRLKETYFAFDSSGKSTDSTVLNEYVFDTLGRIVEHRSHFIWNLREKKMEFMSVVYSYPQSGPPISSINDPFGLSHSNLLSGVYCPDHFAMYCENTNAMNQLENITIRPFHDGPLYTLTFYYAPNLFVFVDPDKIFKKHALDRLDFRQDGRLAGRHVISYER